MQCIVVFPEMRVLALRPISKSARNRLDQTVNFQRRTGIQELNDSKRRNALLKDRARHVDPPRRIRRGARAPARAQQLASAAWPARLRVRAICQERNEGRAS